MSVVLSVYSMAAYKEYVLPAVRDQDHVIVIDSRLFKLAEDLEIHLEETDGKWYFQTSDKYRIQYGTEVKTDSRTVIRPDANYKILASNGSKLSIITSVKETSFQSYTKVVLSGIQDISIGSDENNLIQYSYKFQGNEYISHRMAIIHLLRSGAVLEDVGRNGIFLNDVHVNGKANLKFGDHIHIWGLDMIFLGNILAVRPDANIKIKNLMEWGGYTDDQTDIVENHEVHKYVYHRAPRNIEKINTEPVEIEAPPNPKEIAEMPLFMMIGPALTMAVPMALSSGIAIIGSRASGSTGSMFMYTGIITAVCSALIGATWSIVNMRMNKKRIQSEENHRFEAYSEYLIKCADEVKQKYENNAVALLKMYPGPKQCISPEMQVQNHMWNRNATHRDVLSYRLGLGDIPFQVDISIPKEKFTLVNDSLSDRPKLIKESYSMLKNVPVLADLLENNIVGIIGGERKAGAYDVVYNLTAQIASQNCYTDVKLAYIYQEDQGESNNAWEFAKWLPHAWSPDKKVRYVAASAGEASDVFYEIAKVLRERSEEMSGLSRKHEGVYKPHFIMFVEDPSILEGELIAKYINDRENPMGITVVLMSENYESLPNTCESIIQNDAEFHGLYNVRTGEKVAINFDHIEKEELEAFAKRISNLEVTETEQGGDIPNAITFFDMYNAKKLEDFNVGERWKKNRVFKSMKALVGQMAGGTPCYLDVHEKYHGPHGLVAGTTGSGKSETLQTYMLSLALNFSPDDIGFFIIDYKGGGMANLFNGMPHVLGTISNLSGNQVFRAMVSIKSENRRRQRVFNENGVNNINSYTQLYKNGEADEPIPHLFIIIDEFAELKRDQPDFMRELISVAQVGRSLGVHLILATQKPAGTVDDNIWSNSKFRLCLRVQDRQDSMDMLHKPDAAFLTQAGRCYLQVGNDELYELFQSGWSGASYDEEEGNQKQIIATMLTTTGKAALVGSHQKKVQKEQQKVKWFKELEAVMTEAVVRVMDEDAILSENDLTQEDENKIIETMYDCFEKHNIEYQKNDYNTRALRSFRGLYLKLKNTMDNFAAADPEERAETMISFGQSDNLKLPERKDRTQLDAIVEYLGKVAVAEKYRPVRKLWLPVLPKMLGLTELAGFTDSVFNGAEWPKYDENFELKTMIGLVDDPENQIQFPIDVDFTQYGNIGIIGIAMSGKSILMQTILFGLCEKFSPQYFSFYGLNFSGASMNALEKDVHCGGIIRENDLDNIGKFFRMVRKMIEKRKALFEGGNYVEFIKKNGVREAAVVIAIDNIAAFREKTENKYDDELLQLTREANSYGIYFLISGAGFNSTEIPNRMRDNIHYVVSLEMSDKFAYADVLNTMAINVIPEPGIHGRGLILIDGRTLEFQAAVSAVADNDYDRNDKVSEMCAAMAGCWNGEKVRHIPIIPREPSWDEFVEREEVLELLADDRHMPFAYDMDTADIFSIDLSRVYTYTIQGKSRTGKTNLLKILMQSAAMRKAKIVVIENEGQTLQKIARKLDADYIDNFKAFYDFMLNDFIPVFKSRNALKKSFIDQGMEEEEIYQNMHQEQEYCVFIADICDFTKMLYSDENKSTNLHGGMANLLDKGFLHNIYFFTCLDQDRRQEVIAKDVFEKYMKFRTGCHLGGNVIQQRTFEFAGMPMSEQSLVTKPGIGLTPGDGVDSYHKLVIPYIKTKK